MALPGLPRAIQYNQGGRRMKRVTRRTFMKGLGAAMAGLALPIPPGYEWNGEAWVPARRVYRLGWVPELDPYSIYVRLIDPSGEFAPLPPKRVMNPRIEARG